MTGLRTIQRAAFVGTIAAAFAGSVALSATNTNSIVKPSDAPNRNGRQITLRDQLRTGLKAFTPEDFAFIDLVVLRVEQGKLPRTIVDGTFLWARRRVTGLSMHYSKRPMVYFRPALVQRAKAVGVAL
jgi:hypothetical protein